MTPVPLAAFLDERVRAGAIPSAAWAVVQHGRTLDAGSVGWARRTPRRRRASSSTVYDLASLTKPLATAARAVLLARDGVVSLDEPAGERLPEWAGSPYGRATLLDLLLHRSGLPAWEPLYLHGADMAAYLRRMAALAPVGGVVYSDLGYLAAGELLARAARHPLDRLLRRQVLGPLGETEVRYRPPQAWRGRVAATEADDLTERRMAAERAGPAAAARHPWRTGVVQGQVHDGNAAALGGVAGHAGLFGTVAGVARLGVQFLPGSDLFELDELSLFVTSRTPDQAQERSIGFRLADPAATGALSERAFGHTGFTGTSLFIDPQTAAIFVLLTNRVHPAVPPTDMQALRLEFHRLAAACLTPEPDPLPGPGLE